MSDSGESSISRPTTPITALPETARPFRFTWDPASRRPGPESVSGTTADGRGEYFASKFGEFPLSASTTNLGLGALPSEWSSSKHGFHAISTVLNNPHKRQAPPKAHSSLPAVPPADLPRVRRKDFNSYLNAIGPEWDKYQLGVQQLAEATEPEPEPPTPRQSSITSFDQPSRPPGKSMTPLEVVPRIFFEPKFNFGDPRTFAAVTEQDTALDPNYDPTSLSHSLPLLEKFSHYADTIEMHLTHEISLRSSSFFAALSNLHLLQDESASCLDQVTRLRKLLLEVDEDVAKRGLEVVRLERKMCNLQMVDDGIKGIGEMVEMTGVARGLVSSGQWGEALGLVENLEGVWNASDDYQPPPPYQATNGRLPTIPSTPEEDTEQLPASRKQVGLPVPLSSLNAFSALPEHLRTLTLEIASSLSNELVAVLCEDLLKRIGGAREMASAKPDAAMKERLKPVLDGLLRTRGMREASLSWREVVLNEVRGIVGHEFPAFEVGDVDTKPHSSKANGNSTPSDGPGLANHLRNMSHLEFMQVLRPIYHKLLNAVEGIQAQVVAIGELMEDLQNSPSKPSQSIQSDLMDIMISASELAHAQAAKIVSVRSDQHAAIQLSEFVDLFNESWSFVVKSEIICKRMIVGLRGVVAGQARQFLQAFHQIRLTQSAKLVEDEQWGPQEVSTPLQRVADILVEAAVRDAPELLVLTNPDLPNSSPPSAADGTVSSASSGGAMPQPPPTPTVKGAKHLRIDGHTYFTVPATSDVLTLLLDYLKVIVNVQMLTTDTMGRAIEFLKAFNSRTCQVVLGAGALRSAGLKNITAKHLALASQSLSIMIALIPYVRETFRRHLSQKQAIILVEFDKLKRDYQEHQNEIYAKLIAIMGDRLTYHIKSLQGVDWNVPKNGVNDYMQVLVKETVTLHKVLTRYLPAPVVQDVMSQVFATINHRLSEEYGKLELPDLGAKDRLLADAKYLHERLSSLKGVGTPNAMLETVIRENTLPRTPSATPTRTSTIFSPAPSPVPLPSAGITNISTNERLRGLLSSRKISFGMDKALPTPSAQPTNGSINGDSAPTPPEKSAEDVTQTSSGFKQIEMDRGPTTPVINSPIHTPDAPLAASPVETVSTDSLIPEPSEADTKEPKSLEPLPPMSADIPSEI